MMDRLLSVLTAQRARPRSLGQSLVEFALILPILLLLVMIAVDFGRIYLGFENLQNAARIAANFAANNPDAWIPSALDTAVITKYQNQVNADLTATNCKLNPTTPVDPTFADTNGDGNIRGIGDRASVTFTCGFNVITPIISNILGGTVNVTTTATFPVKSALSATSSGNCAPIPVITANPTSGAAPLTVTFGGSAGVSWVWNFGDGGTSTLQNPTYQYATAGTWVATLTVSNGCGSATTNPGTTITVGSAPLCVVPGLSGIKINSADTPWHNAGFTTDVQRAPSAPNGNFTITSQSISGGSSVACTSTIQVNG